MEEKLKKIIFKKLFEDLSHVQIIEHYDSVWFIDADKKYWYLEYKKNGMLYWRYSFFVKFFELFSMESEEFQSVISEWVEEVLNCKVINSGNLFLEQPEKVNKILDYTVIPLARLHQVSEVMGCNIYTPTMFENGGSRAVKNVLNRRVTTTMPGDYMTDGEADQVLNYEKLT
jgi:hypothetical protein